MRLYNDTLRLGQKGTVRTGLAYTIAILRKIINFHVME